MLVQSTKITFKYNMVPKLIGSELLVKLQYIGQKPLKYVHIDMNFNFMHILALKDMTDLPYIYWIKHMIDKAW